MMRFVYGKQDFRTMERGNENCYLLTNGLGGFSSMTMTGAVTRNDHTFLMACLQAPNHRYNLVHRLSEKIVLGGKEYFLSSQQFADDREEENGYRHLSCFSVEEFPEWLYQVCGIEVKKQIAMKQGSNTVAVQYTVENRTAKACTLRIIPYLQFVGKGQDLEKTQKFEINREKCSADVEVGMYGGAARISSNGINLYLQTNGTISETELQYETCFYAYDVCDGRRETGLAAANHRIEGNVPAGETLNLEIVYSTEENPGNAETIFAEEKVYQEQLQKAAGFTNPVAQALVKSADQFISERESTGGKTILAGFPFFEDWGRDTMIALTGCAISTGQYETVKSILRTFMANEKGGLMPNLFPEGGNEPLYNTVDAALLFINAVYLYYVRTQDAEFVKEAYPVMKRIVEVYQKGTHFGIRMDEDGLIMAGQNLDQVTWMDVRVGEILPTPRHGKPVEINAYWYNALRIMELFAARIAETSVAQTDGQEAEDGIRYGVLAEQVKESFGKKFWMEEKRCLKDVISKKETEKAGAEKAGDASGVSDKNPDTQIRCNQIWAVSMPFTMLPKEMEKQVVETVFEKLYTPYGLRTLEEADAEFHPFYGGEQLNRDLAYHQGTVWTFPLGAYYLAYLKVSDYSEQAKEAVRCQLSVMEAALREGCIGQLPEIYDGGNPTNSKGCFAQAWSVGEMLRVFEALERD